MVTIRDTETYFLTKLLMYQKLRFYCIRKNIHFSKIDNLKKISPSLNSKFKKSTFKEYPFFKWSTFLISIWEKFTFKKYPFLKISTFLNINIRKIKFWKYPFSDLIKIQLLKRSTFSNIHFFKYPLFQISTFSNIHF